MAVRGLTIHSERWRKRRPTRKWPGMRHDPRSRHRPYTCRAAHPRHAGPRGPARQHASFVQCSALARRHVKALNACFQTSTLVVSSNRFIYIAMLPSTRRAVNLLLATLSHTDTLNEKAGVVTVHSSY
jgi:hypothetical protein